MVLRHIPGLSVGQAQCRNLRQGGGSASATDSMWIISPRIGSYPSVSLACNTTEIEIVVPRERMQTCCQTKRMAMIIDGLYHCLAIIEYSHGQ